MGIDRDVNVESCFLKFFELNWVIIWQIMRITE